MRVFVLSIAVMLLIPIAVLIINWVVQLAAKLWAFVGRQMAASYAKRNESDDEQEDQQTDFF